MQITPRCEDRTKQTEDDGFLGLAFLENDIAKVTPMSRNADNLTKERRTKHLTTTGETTIEVSHDEGSNSSIVSWPGFQSSTDMMVNKPERHMQITEIKPKRNIEMIKNEAQHLVTEAMTLLSARVAWMEEWVERCSRGNTTSGGRPNEGKAGPDKVEESNVGISTIETQRGHEERMDGIEALAESLEKRCLLDCSRSLMPNDRVAEFDSTTRRCIVSSSSLTGFCPLCLFQLPIPRLL